MSKKGQIKREDLISNKALNWGDEYAKTIKKAIKANKKFTRSALNIIHLQNQITAIQKLKADNAILVKRDRALRERFAYMMWLKFTDEFDCNEENTIKELDRLNSCYEIDKKLSKNPKAPKIMYLNRNWFVNKHLDAFLSQFS